MDSYVGQILLVPYNFVPEGWANCNGQLLQVSQYQALYSLVGNNFGGTVPTTFGVPNLLPSAPSGCMYIIALNGIYPPRS